VGHPLLDILLSHTHYARQCLKCTSLVIYAAGAKSVLRGSQGIRGYISVTFFFFSLYIFKLNVLGFVKNNLENFLIGDMLFRMNFIIAK